LAKAKQAGNAERHAAVQLAGQIGSVAGDNAVEGDATDADPMENRAAHRFLPIRRDDGQAGVQVQASAPAARYDQPDGQARHGPHRAQDGSGR